MQFKTSYSSLDRPLLPWYMRLVIRTLSVFAVAYGLDGVEIDKFTTAIWVALALGVLNALVKPLLILLTLPFTLFTMGLFLLIINGLVVVLADYWVDGFSLESFGTAILFSILISLTSGLLERLHR